MSDELTRILAAWERDRERLTKLTNALDHAMTAAELGVFRDGDDPHHALNTLLAQAQGLATVELRERLTAVTEERDTFAKAMDLYRDDYYRVRAQRDALAPLAIRRVGTWWIVRGRHGTGFHRFDGLNMSEAEAQAQAQRLLPTITDDQVTAMYEMMQEGKA